MHNKNALNELTCMVKRMPAFLHIFSWVQRKVRTRSGLNAANEIVIK